MSEPETTYNDVPYSTFTFPQTRPDRLASLATYYGMTPAHPEKCRVLELGCGSGANLISFAYNLPNSKFIGIDLSSVHIDKAKATVEHLGLKNIEFYCMDLMEMGDTIAGKFDYIIAHGLFSWIPEPVRDKVLAIYAERLEPNGIGYISYNTYPGCKMREVVWDMMKFHTRDITDPFQKVNAGIQYLQFINFSAEKDSAFRSVIESELSKYSQRTPSNIFHDDFAEINKPLYFTEFVDLIADHGMQFLTEVDSNWPEAAIRPEIAAKLEELDNDILKKEQYIDYIRGRVFRSTLVCRNDVTLSRQPDETVLSKFYLGSQVEIDAEDDLGMTVKLEGGHRYTCKNRFTLSCLMFLSNAWSENVAYETLIDEVKSGFPDISAEQIAHAARELRDLSDKGFVYLYTHSPKFSPFPSERPRASRFVQWQINERCEQITSLSGMNLTPDGDLMRLLLLLADGTRSGEEIIDELSRRVTVDVSNSSVSKEQLKEMVNARLNDLARLGLFHA